MLLYSYTGWDGWLVLLGADAISGDAWPMLLCVTQWQGVQETCGCLVRIDDNASKKK